MVASGWVTQVLRIWAGQPWADLEWTVGPVPLGDGQGKEVMSRFSAPLVASGTTFYTDSNGRDMYRRVLNECVPAFVARCGSRCTCTLAPLLQTSDVQPLRA